MAAGKSVIDFCTASGPIKGLKEVDVAHNIGAAANEVVKTLTILRDNMACQDLDELFTRSENAPTPAVSPASPHRYAVLSGLGPLTNACAVLQDLDWAQYYPLTTVKHATCCSV